MVIATACDDDREVVRLLDAGADDYLVTPFSAAQAMARVRAVLRCTASEVAEQGGIATGGLRVHPVARTVLLEAREVSSNRKEFDLLFALASRAGEVVSERHLPAQVWQLPWGGADPTVGVHVSWLRRELGETAAEPRYLQTVRGAGVKLLDPGTAVTLVMLRQGWTATGTGRRPRVAAVDVADRGPGRGRALGSVCSCWRRCGSTPNPVRRSRVVGLSRRGTRALPEDGVVVSGFLGRAATRR